MNIKKISIILIIIIICIFTIFIMKGYAGDSQDEELNSKVDKELEYVSNKLIYVMNKINNINFSAYVLKIEKNEDNSSSNKSESKEQDSSSGGGSSGSSSSSEGSQGGSSNSSTGTSENTSDGLQKFEFVQGGILAGEDDTIDWKYIKSEIESLNSVLPTIIIDLHGLNVENSDILGFSSALDNLIKIVKNEDKSSVLVQIANLYGYIPKIKSQYKGDIKETNVSYSIAYVLNSYALSEQENWNEMKAQITSAINYYSKVINNVDTNGNQNKINKVYILLNELDSSLTSKDKELYYIKYKCLMEDMVRL